MSFGKIGGGTGREGAPDPIWHLQISNRAPREFSFVEGGQRRVWWDRSTNVPLMRRVASFEKRQGVLYVVVRVRAE